jgi:hypothetical protein
VNKFLLATDDEGRTVFLEAGMFYNADYLTEYLIGLNLV